MKQGSSTVKVSGADQLILDILKKQVEKDDLILEVWGCKRGDIVKHAGAQFLLIKPASRIRFESEHIRHNLPIPEQTDGTYWVAIFYGPVK
jgi:hypothetical protein